MKQGGKQPQRAAEQNREDRKICKDDGNIIRGEQGREETGGRLTGGCCLSRWQQMTEDTLRADRFITPGSSTSATQHWGRGEV